jgi:glycogen operon protein
VLGELATRVAGSVDIFGPSRRRPHASINFVTCHDGFTMADLVSYERKHNEANGEDNRDGTDDNRSWNHGVEGPSDDPEVLAARARDVRAVLMTLLLSRGVPMLLGGDELGRTQLGNNNAYCQDNEVSWFDWAGADPDLLAFTRAAVAMRRAHPVLRRRRYLADPGYSVWFAPDGTAMSPSTWQQPGRRAVAVFVDGTVAPDRDAVGRPLLDQHLLALVNGSAQPVPFVIPVTNGSPGAYRWALQCDTADLAPPAVGGVAGVTREPGSSVLVAPRSLQVHWSVPAG